MQGTFIKLFNGIVLSPFKMARLSSEQKTKVVQFYLQTGSIIETKRKLCSMYRPKNTPSSRAISRLTQNFIATGTTSEQTRSVRKPIVSDDISQRSRKSFFDDDNGNAVKVNQERYQGVL